MAIKYPLIILIIIFGSFTLSTSSKASMIIRDTEIENMLTEWMNPLLKANNMPENSINIIIVQSPDINAFVAGGKNIFIYTGLLEKSENPEEVIGVLSHELGHIVGGHLIRSKDAIEQASYEMILGTLLGIGTAIVTGEGAAAAVISAGANEMAKRRFFKFSRIQESSADQAAIRTLKDAKLPLSGLASFMEKLKHEELMPEDKQSEYIRTHPLTSDRVDTLNNAVTINKKKFQINKNWYDQHKRMKAKLLGFIKPNHINWQYDDTDNSIHADYARAISFYKKNDIDQSIKYIDNLIKREKDNPYFIELKAQILMDFGYIEEAVDLYQQSAKILTNSPLIKSALAHALIEHSRNNKNEQELLNQAINNLEFSISKDPRSTMNYRLMATAYGKTNRENHKEIAQIYLAEEAYLKGNYQYAINRAQSAINNIEENSKYWLKANDIIHFSQMAIQ